MRCWSQGCQLGRRARVAVATHTWRYCSASTHPGARSCWTATRGHPLARWLSQHRHPSSLLFAHRQQACLTAAAAAAVPVISSHGRHPHQTGPGLPRDRDLVPLLPYDHHRVAAVLASALWWACRPHLVGGKASSARKRPEGVGCRWSLSAPRQKAKVVPSPPPFEPALAAARRVVAVWRGAHAARRGVHAGAPAAAQRHNAVWPRARTARMKPASDAGSAAMSPETAHVSAAPAGAATAPTEGALCLTVAPPSGGGAHLDAAVQTEPPAADGATGSWAELVRAPRSRRPQPRS